jgi:hypothetical protein
MHAEGIHVHYDLCMKLHISHLTMLALPTTRIVTQKWEENHERCYICMEQALTQLR